jgi:hypothetical protein
LHLCAQGNEYATYTYPDGRERHTVNGQEQIGTQQHAPSQRIRRSPTPPPPPPPPIQTNALPPPPPPYSNLSRKRESPTSVSGRSRDMGREHHSPIEIQSSSHAGSPPPPPPLLPPPVPPINHSYSHSHHYRPPPPPSIPSHYRGADPNMPAVQDRSYEKPHYKSRRWK